MTHGTFVYNNKTNALNDNEFPNLLFFAIEEKNTKEKKPRDDNEPLSSLSSSST